MNWHFIWVAVVFIVLGAFIGSKFPAVNLIGRVTG